MTGQERDYEAVLSRVLHTTADQLEPVGDGLTKIRARLSEPWLKRQWWLLRSELMVLRWLVVVRFEAFFSTVKSGKPGSAAADSAAGPLAALLACATPDTEEHGRRRRSLRPVLSAITAWAASRGPGRGNEDGPRSPHGPVMNWLRPALAMAGAVVLVVGGVFALGNIQQGFGFIGLGADGGSQPGASSQASRNGNPNGTASAITGQPSGSPAQGRSGTANPGASGANSKTGASPSPCASQSVPPVSSPSPTAASPTPTPTPTPSPTPTPTPTPSPTPSTSGAPLTSGMGAQTQEAIGTTALVMCEQPAPSPSNQAPAGP